MRQSVDCAVSADGLFPVGATVIACCLLVKRGAAVAITLGQRPPGGQRCLAQGNDIRINTATLVPGPVAIVRRLLRAASFFEGSTHGV